MSGFVAMLDKAFQEWETLPRIVCQDCGCEILEKDFKSHRGHPTSLCEQVKKIDREMGTKDRRK